MRLFIPLLWLAVLAASVPSLAQPPHPAVDRRAIVDPDAALCARTPAKCPRFKHVLSFPAHGLAPSSAGNFAHHARGVEWTGASGSLSLTVRRPADFSGDRLRLLLFY